MRGIVLFAHGSRDPGWARPFEEIRARISATRPEYPVAVAYLERMEPTLEQAIEQVIDQGALAITVFPLFMAEGGHMREDLPRMVEAIRAERQRIPISLEPPIGDVPEIIAAIAAWVLGRAGG